MTEHDEQPQPLYKSLLRRTSLIRDEERAPVLLACLYFFCLLAGYFILRPVREQMGLAGGVRNLPYLWLGTLAGTLVANLPFTWLVSRFPRRVFLPWVYRFFVLNLVGLFFLFQLVPTAQPGEATPLVAVWLGRGFYVWLSVFNMFAVTVFWGLMSDLFRLEQARRLFGFIGVGGTLGALVGSAVTSELAGPLSRDAGGPGLEWLLLLSACLIGVAVRAVTALTRLAEHGPSESPGDAGEGETRSRQVIGGSFRSGVQRILSSRYLQSIALYIVLYTMASSVLYFQQAHIVDAHFAGREGEQTAFFARVNFAVQSLTLILQLFLTGRIMRRIGVGLSLMALPALVAVGFGWLGFAHGGEGLTTLWVLVGFTVAMKGAEYALAKPARETLYTVVDQETRYKSKAFIDTFVYRGGDAATAVLYKALGGLGVATVAFMMVPVALFWMRTALGLGRRQEALARVPEESR